MCPIMYDNDLCRQKKMRGRALGRCILTRYGLNQTSEPEFAGALGHSLRDLGSCL